jgi:energy-coupling factor transporter transmembrane protein EcfT
MPHFYVHWLEEALSATVFMALIVFGFLNEKPAAIAVGFILLGSIVAQARWAALRVRRGEKP